MTSIPDNELKSMQSSINVLHVEDEKMIADQVKFILRSKFPHLTQAPNGAEGLKAFKRGSFDIVITDINMPEMDGITMARHIREIAPEVQIIIHSALEKRSYLVDALNLGIDQFIEKQPSNTHEILLALERSAREVLLRKKIQSQNRNIKKLSIALEQSSTIMVVYDEMGRFDYANNKFYTQFQYDPDKLAGTHITHNKDESFIQLWEKVGRELRAAGDYRYIDSYGKEIWVYSDITAIFENNEISYYLEITNIFTERKEFEFELKKAKEDALAASLAKTLFLANMSHELRTPLNGILGMANLLLETPLTPKQSDYLSMLKSSGESFLRIINNILDFSKLESGRVDIIKQEFDLFESINSTIDFFKLSAAAKGLKLKLNIDPNVPQYVIGDSGRLAQVLNNIIGNAIKFTESGRVTVYIEQDTRFSMANSKADEIKLRFRVLDTGIGIPDDKLATIFDRFSQVDSSYTRKYGGTGLGLSISHELVSLMGGELRASSRLHQGSEFTFDIVVGMPNKINSKASTSHKDSIEQYDTPSRQLNILVAEDNEINLTVISEFLKKFSHTVQTVTDGKQLLELFAFGTFDLLIVDVEMPKMNGLEAVEKIREIEKNTNLSHTPILALTAHYGEDRRLEVLNHGFDDFMSKPVQFDKFKAKIAMLTGEKITASIDDSIPLNINTLVETFGSNPETLHRILRKFLDELPNQFADLEKARKDEKLKDVQFQAHRLKSAMGNLNAKAAELAAIEIEKAAKSNDFANIDLNIESLAIEVKSILDYLSILLKDSSA